MTIRKMNHEDINKVARLFTRLVEYLTECGDPYLDLETSPERGFRLALSMGLKDKNKIVFIAVDDNEIIGFIGGEIKSPFIPLSKVKKIGYVESAYIDEEYRNKGIMKRLEKKLIVFFMKAEVQYVELNVLSSNIEGKSAWQSLGYTTFREQMRKEII